LIFYREDLLKEAEAEVEEAASEEEEEAVIEVVVADTEGWHHSLYCRSYKFTDAHIKIIPPWWI
jgi:hypothetical protein